MIYRFPLRDVKDMLLNQIGNNFFKSIEDERLITKHMERTLERLELNISANDNKYYWKFNAEGGRDAYFDPLHTCQWALFLYLTANTMPDTFAFDHPTGSFMGRAVYGEGFSFTQGCTVGNLDEVYPVIGRGVQMCAGSKVLGSSRIGDGCLIGEGAVVRNEDVPDGSAVYGKSPNLKIAPRD